jgi:hypothetical protein
MNAVDRGGVAWSPPSGALLDPTEAKIVARSASSWGLGAAASRPERICSPKRFSSSAPLAIDSCLSKDASMRLSSSSF